MFKIQQGAQMVSCLNEACCLSALATSKDVVARGRVCRRAGLLAAAPKADCWRGGDSRNNGNDAGAVRGIYEEMETSRMKASSGFIEAYRCCCLGLIGVK